MSVIDGGVVAAAAGGGGGQDLASPSDVGDIGRWLISKPHIVHRRT